MPRVRLQDVQDFHDEVANDGRRPTKIKKASAWDDRSRNPNNRKAPPKSKESQPR